MCLNLNFRRTLGSGDCGTSLETHQVVENAVLAIDHCPRGALLQLLEWTGSPRECGAEREVIMKGTLFFSSNVRKCSVQERQGGSGETKKNLRFDYEIIKQMNEHVNSHVQKSCEYNGSNKNWVIVKPMEGKIIDLSTLGSLYRATHLGPFLSLPIIFLKVLANVYRQVTQAIAELMCKP